MAGTRKPRLPPHTLKLSGEACSATKVASTASSPTTWRARSSRSTPSACRCRPWWAGQHLPRRLRDGGHGPRLGRLHGDAGTVINGVALQDALERVDVMTRVMSAIECAGGRALHPPADHRHLEKSASSSSRGHRQLLLHRHRGRAGHGDQGESSSKGRRWTGSDADPSRTKAKKFQQAYRRLKAEVMDTSPSPVHGQRPAHHRVQPQGEGQPQASSQAESAPSSRVAMPIKNLVADAKQRMLVSGDRAPRARDMRTGRFRSRCWTASGWTLRHPYPLNQVGAWPPRLTLITIQPWGPSSSRPSKAIRGSD